MYERILGLSPQADSNRVDSNTIDLSVIDFPLLAAIGPILRQFSVISGLRTNDDASARELPMTDRTREIQSIVTVKLQLGVRAESSAS